MSTMIPEAPPTLYDLLNARLGPDNMATVDTQVPCGPDNAMVLASRVPIQRCGRSEIPDRGLG